MAESEIRSLILFIEMWWVEARHDSESTWICWMDGPDETSMMEALEEHRAALPNLEWRLIKTTRTAEVVDA